ncbi:MAG: hypothetical protein AAF380_01380 [Bacteroidota bacterium]
MKKISRITIFLSSLVTFLSIFAYYINPKFAWYEKVLVNFLDHEMGKLQIFNLGHIFSFKNQFLSDEKIIKAFFTNPKIIFNLFLYTPTLLLISNTILLMSSIINSRSLALLSSTSMTALVFFSTQALNFFIKNECYPMHISLPSLLAGSIPCISLLSALLAPKKHKPR